MFKAWLSQHGVKDVLHLMLGRKEGESGNKGGQDDGLMEWMSNCVDESG